MFFYKNTAREMQTTGGKHNRFYRAVERRDLYEIEITEADVNGDDVDGETYRERLDNLEEL